MTSVAPTERRAKPRIYHPFPATIRGTDVNGDFEMKTILDNLSSGGLYVRLPQPIEPGSTLTVTISFNVTDYKISAPQIKVEGVVVRSELKSDGRCGVAVRITKRRFT